MLGRCNAHSATELGQLPPWLAPAGAAVTPPTPDTKADGRGDGSGPRLCEKSLRCYDSFVESVVGGDGCQALWKGLTGAKAHFSPPHLTTTWTRTIRFVRLMLLLKVSILASLALFGLRRWNKGGPVMIRRRCSRYTFMAISIGFRRAAGLSASASVISS